ncbi:hypothetical protein B0H11DRAFT_1718136, partial [Mycena galericulata]
VPVYDATSKNFDFLKDLPTMKSVLPVWSGEVPIGSFVVVGYTAVTYSGKAGDHGYQVHVGCNLLWVVVCGTPL